MTGQPSTSDTTLPQPRMSDRGFVVGPCIRPKLARRIADALAALNALRNDDPDRDESSHFTSTPGSIAIYNADMWEDLPRDANDQPVGENRALVGWLHLEDENCWVFVPYVAQIEEPSDD
jgi:hypothetical protein